MFKIMRMLLFMIFALIMLNMNLAEAAFFIDYSGSLDNSDQTWNRPHISGTSLSPSPLGNSAYYEIQPFWVDSELEYTFENLSRAEHLDPFFALYKGNFDALDPIADLVGVDDDKAGDLRPLIADLEIAANTQYYLVTTSFGNSQTGGYKNRIYGDGIINLGEYRSSTVPEPATILLLGGGLAGAIWRKRKVSK